MLERSRMCLAIAWFTGPQTGMWDFVSADRWRCAFARSVIQASVAGFALIESAGSDDSDDAHVRAPDARRDRPDT